MYIDHATQLETIGLLAMSSESSTMLGMTCSASDREEHHATATLRKQVDVAIIGET